MSEVLALLDEYQQRLEQHFGALASSRAEQGGEVFALEHGFDAEALRPVFSALNASILLPVSGSKHWLVWVIYAAELGYDYDGTEYWESFAERTPNWRFFEDRHLISRCYLKFVTEFRGVKTTGRWAGQFRIIAWPITHAILPKDLQVQLARALYERRYGIAALGANDARAIGELIARITYGASSRFRIFVEQEELVGRIVLALLGTGNQSQNILHPAALKRLVSDLERTRNAREWLSDARRDINRTRMRGLGSPGHAQRTSSSESPSARVIESISSVRPLFSLRCVSDRAWAPVLQFPNFGSVAAIDSEIARTLRTSRVSPGGPTNWKPAGWLMFGSQSAVLADWPNPGEALLVFEKPNVSLDQLVRAEATMSSQSLFLFKIGSDGLARELVTKVVRPGENYVLLHTKPLTADGLLKAARTTCTGVSATELALPKSLTAVQESALAKLSLSIAKTLRVWPVGLPARAWDGEGQSEWIAGEKPSIAIANDHYLDSITIDLDGGQEVLQVSSPGPASVTLVDLGDLALGVHTLRVTAKRSVQQFSTAMGEGLLYLKVRPPEPWIPGSINHAGLIVTCAPVEPSLDDVWTGSVEIAVNGPEDRAVEVTTELLGAANELLRQERVGAFRLPIVSETWKREYARVVQSWQKSDPWSYLLASRGNLIVDADELGRFVIPLSRDVAPLRWISKAKGGVAIRLMDDTGTEAEPEVTQYTFDKPTIAVVQVAKTVLAGFAPSWPGGLFVAKSGGSVQAIIASPAQAQGDFSSLSVPVAIHSLPSDRASVAPLLDKYAMWANAKLCGPLAVTRKNTVLRELLAQVFRIICGTRWGDLERRYYNDSSAGNERALEENIGWPIGFALAVSRARDIFWAVSARERVDKLRDIAKSFSITTDGALCEAALRLAGQPHNYLAWAGERAPALAQGLFNCPAVLKAARFVALMGSTHEQAFPGPLAKGWDG